MEGKKFFIQSLVASFLLVAVLVFINFQLDIFGLYHSTIGKSISIYDDERGSKYLLAHRYVPENFEGYLLGPSLSANINTKQESALKIYNLSMMGANITEQKAVFDKALERGTPQVIILCLHPYLTIDHGMKTKSISPNYYYGALGSISLYKTYAFSLIRNFNWLPSKFPKDQFNDYGFNNYNDFLKVQSVEKKIEEQLKKEDAVKTSIDSVAWIEFNQVIQKCIAKKIKIIAYFHPLPYSIYDKFRVALDSYKKTMEGALNEKAIVIDFNTPTYEVFTKDLSNYIDHGHLSEKGQAYLWPEILNQANLKPLQHN